MKLATWMDGVRTTPKAKRLDCSYYAVRLRKAKRLGGAKP